MANNYLQHHGILGQKWGVRRFQNKDGSLTALGKQRYSDSDRRNIYNQLKDKGKMERRNSLFKDYYFDESDSEDLKEAGAFLKSQYKAAEKKGYGLQKNFQSEVAGFISNPGNNKKVFDRLREIYSNSDLDDDFVPDSYDMEFAVADLISDKFYENNKQSISEYVQMQKTYDDNVRKITNDLVGSLANERVTVLSDKKNIFGVQKTVKKKYSKLMGSSLEKLSGGSSWELPRIEYDGDDLGGISEMLGPMESKWNDYCESLAREYNK